MSPKPGTANILTFESRYAAGRALRQKLGRTAHSGFTRAAHAPDLLAIIRASNAGRLPHLVPIKMGRMAVSPFAFYRGSAPLMASDLSALPVSGLNVQICGDAHVRNLGAYAGGADEHLVFDLNDFDETILGPWEWDLKRLSASVVLAGREAHNSEDVCTNAVRVLVCSYRQSIRRFAEMNVLELARLEIRGRGVPSPVDRVLQKAARQTPQDTLKKLTVCGKNSLPRFDDEPPVLKHMPDATAKSVLDALRSYRKTLGANRQLIFDAFKPVDVAFKIVGTGSVGMRDYVVLMLGNGPNDPLFLQVKEAVASCYAPHLAHANPPAHHGQRVVQGQQRMQTVSDPFLGWTSIGRFHFFVRQLADHKASLEPEDLKGRVLPAYVEVCGEVLAKAHARTGDAATIAGYCGNSELDEAFVNFAKSYADQTSRDYDAFIKLIRGGRIKAAKAAG